MCYWSVTSIGKFVKIKLSHAIDTTASSITDFRNNLTLFDYSDADNRNDLIASDADISFSGNEISIKLTGLTADDSGDLYFEYDDDSDALVSTTGVNFRDFYFSIIPEDYTPEANEVGGKPIVSSAEIIGNEVKLTFTGGSLHGQ